MYHVFLADDEPWALMTLKNMIEWSEYGFAVSGEAEDGEQALARINRTAPDLIISDIRMPGMDGLALLQTSSCAACTVASDASTHRRLRSGETW